MHRISALLIVVLGLGLYTGAANGQSCTGLCQQQQTCPGNTTTSISGVVYAPNGTDPLPNVTVYVPNAPVDAFSAGVSCPVVGTPPSGSPLVGTITNVDGSFTIQNMPVGANIPLVIVSGRWRRQLVIPGVAACQNTALPTNFAVMPKNQSEGDIPKIAIATGSVDQVECVLRKMGISDSEFTDPAGTGRINLFGGTAAGSGSVIDSSTPTQASLMGNQSLLNQYDVLMLPCEGAAYTKPAQELANLIGFANAGGRVYASHFSYTWMYQNPPFDSVVNWAPGQASLDSGTATVNTSFTAGQTLQTWLQEVGASTTPGQMALNTLRVDTRGVIAPTQDWLDLNDSAYNNPTMQFVFDTPIPPPGQTVNQCGRVLFNEYHVEGGTSSPAAAFPSECAAAGTAMTPQEKLLEYMLFELTSEGGQPSMAPTSANFGSVAVGFPSAPLTFTWTNNSSFPLQVTSALLSGSNDFTITSNNCNAVAAGTSCQIAVVFKPSALGAESATLTVQSGGGSQLSAPLTGTGTPGFTLSGNSLTYGNLDVGASSAQTLTLTNIASSSLPVPPFVTTGQYSVDTSACGTSVVAGAQCAIKVTFLPTATGSQNGTLGVNSTSLLYNGLSATMTGNGVDFTLSLNPTSGKVVAGDSQTTTAVLAPLAGYASAVTLKCVFSSGAIGTGCNVPGATITPPGSMPITLSTTSQYTVVGYSFGGRGWLWLIALASGLLLWCGRRSAGSLRLPVLLLLLASVGLSITGCSGKLPAKNAAYTGPGTYSVVVTATDGFLVHTATYTLTVSAK